MKKIENIKHIKQLVLLCAAVYFVSYLTRINYAAVLVEIIQSEEIAKTAASIPLTVLFVSYGFGQLVSGYMGDCFQPEKLIMSGLLLTTAMNVALPISQSYLWMTAVWCVNGFAQALMWPPIVKIMTTYLLQVHYKKYIAYVTYGSHLGTMVVYFMAPAVIQMAGWKMVFLLSALLALVMLLVWKQKIYHIEEYAREVTGEARTENKEKISMGYLPFSGTAVLLLMSIMLANVPQGILRDGVSSWMPTYITDVFQVKSSISILTGVALPIFSIIVTYMTSLINRKWIKNEAALASLFFGISIISNYLLCTAGKQMPLLSVLCLLLMNAMANGINFTYTNLAVANFEKYGKTAFVTGAINSSVYIGSAISMYGIAYITEHFGWDSTLLAWGFISCIGLVVCMSSVSLFHKIKSTNK